MDFAQTDSPLEFSAIIILNDTSGIRNTPRSMLPILNLSIFEIQLHHLFAFNHKKILLAMPLDHYSIYENVCTLYLHLGAEFRFIAIDKQNTICDILSKCQTGAILKSEIILLMDGVVTDIDLNRMIETHVANDASLTCAFNSLTNDEANERVMVGTQKGLKDQMVFYRGHPLLKEEKIGIKTIKKFPSILIRPQMQNGGIFILSASAIPGLTKWRKKTRDSEMDDQIINSALSQWTQNYNNGVAPNGTKTPHVQIYDIPKNTICQRVSSMKSYKQLNMKMLQKMAAEDLGVWGEVLQKSNLLGETQRTNKKCKISKNCVFGQSVTLGENGVFKKSVIGSHSVIEKNVRVLNSVVMDHVTIGEGSVIKDSVLVSNVRIGSKSQIESVVEDFFFEN